MVHDLNVIFFLLKTTLKKSGPLYRCGGQAESRRPNRHLPLRLTHGVAAAWTSGVVGDPEPKAPWRAGDPCRRGELAPRVGPRRGAHVPPAPPPPLPPPLRHIQLRRSSRGDHTARAAAARQQGRPLPAEQVGAAAAGHLHLEAQETAPGARRRAAGLPGPGDPIPHVI
jgi:hypothetical protein